jgi:hypothetical protein
MIAHDFDLFDSPNLDCLSVDAEDLEAACVVLGLLSYYAKLKARAMRARAAGKIATALELERKCDMTYNRLPAGARW